MNQLKLKIIISSFKSLKINEDVSESVLNDIFKGIIKLKENRSHFTTDIHTVQFFKGFKLKITAYKKGYKIQPKDEEENASL